MRSKRKIFIVGGVVIIAALVAIILLTRRGDSPTYYQTAIVRTGSISTYITATGTVNPTVQVEIGTQISGIIDRIHVDYNSEVKKGDLLAEIDRTILEAALRSAQMEFSSTQAALNFQRRNFERTRVLFSENAISNSEFEAAEFEYLRAKFAHERSQASITTARTNLSHTRIYSPIDGVVLSRVVDEGQTVAASLNAPTLFRIANDMRNMRVIANVDEADIGQVRVGQYVTFTVDAFLDEVFEGEVIQVRLEPIITSNVVTYSVVINAPNPDLKLMPGLTANVMVRTMQKDDILIIPTQALRFSPSNNAQELPELARNQRLVWIMDNGEMLPKAIVTGDRDAINFEVISGLTAGMEIVLSEEQTQTIAARPEQTARNPFVPERPRGMRMR